VHYLVNFPCIGINIAITGVLITLIIMVPMFADVDGQTDMTRLIVTICFMNTPKNGPSWHQCLCDWSVSGWAISRVNQKQNQTYVCHVETPSFQKSTDSVGFPLPAIT